MKIRNITAVAFTQLCAIGLLTASTRSLGAEMLNSREMQPMKPIDAHAAVAQMTPAINIGNTLEATGTWETGWGNPPITREYVQQLARLGFKAVRLPVAWDTYSDNGQITPKQAKRVGEVIDWITEAGMYCVVNIHWDGGWIDSDWKEKYPDTYHTFSTVAEKKYRSYWEQISHLFGNRDQKLIFEALNEESSFDHEPNPYDTINRVNQIFVDTVRGTGGNNAQRLLVIAGYNTDIDKTCNDAFHIPKDTAPDRLLLSVHYYTPWPFVGMNEDASWGKKQDTWGSEADVKLLNDLFDKLSAFCKRTNTPAFIGEFSMCSNKERDSAILWTKSVWEAAVKRHMVPVMWDTGGAVARRAPYAPSPQFLEVMNMVKKEPTSSEK